MNMRTAILIVMITILLHQPIQAAVTVGNLVVAQRPETKRVDITYDVSNDMTNLVSVALVVSNGMQRVNTTSLTGDVGAGVSIGTGKTIVWDAGADWSGNIATLNFFVSVDDIAGAYPVSKTGQTSSFRTGDDGYYQKGVDWLTPRFTDHGDDTVTDNLTGLMWLKSRAGTGNTYWNNTIDYVNDRVTAGYSDWRLPNRKESLSLIDYGSRAPALLSGHPFPIVPHGSWTSTTAGSDPSSVWIINLYTGYMSIIGKDSVENRWPVRGGQADSLAPVPNSGQKVIYRTGDDGEHQAGVDWPSPRFIDHRDGTVADKLHGLEWVSVPHSLPGNPGGMAWSNAIDFCEGLTYANRSDWRLPNIRELESLMNCGTGAWGDQPYEWFNSNETPFSGVQNIKYWSSTTYNGNPSSRFHMDMGNGSVSISDTNSYLVWPVRGGQ